MRTFSLICFVLIVASQTCLAQIKPVEKKGILYSSSYGIGAQIYGKSWSTHFEWAKIKDLHVRNFYQVEIAQLRHPKEIRQLSDFANQGFSIPSVNAPRQFVYGKQNNFYLLNLSKGQERMIGQRAAKSGVEVSFKYMVGFSLGVLKPYYLQLLVPGNNSDEFIFQEEKYTEVTKAHFLAYRDDSSNASTIIYGAAALSKGFDEPKFIPGGQLKAGLKFDWAFFDEYIKALEVGGVVNVYPRRVPIMVIKNNPKVFVNFYLGIQFGKKKS